MIGADAIIDPVTFQPIPPNMIQMGVNDLLPDYDARGVGALRQTSKQQQQQSMLMLMQTAQTNPVAIQMVNWQVWFRNLFQVFDIPNPDELLNTNDAIQQIMQQQMAALNQQTAGGGGGGGNTPTPNLTNAGSGALQ